MKHLKKLIYGTIILGFVLFAPINVFAGGDNNGSVGDILDNVGSVGAGVGSDFASCLQQAKITAQSNAQSAKHFDESFERVEESEIGLGQATFLYPERQSSGGSSGPAHVKVKGSSSQECRELTSNSNESVVFDCTVEAVDGFEIVQDFLADGKPERLTSDQVNGDEAIHSGAGTSVGHKGVWNFEAMRRAIEDTSVNDTGEGVRNT